MYVCDCKREFGDLEKVGTWTIPEITASESGALRPRGTTDPWAWRIEEGSQGHGRYVDWPASGQAVATSMTDGLPASSTRAKVAAKASSVSTRVASSP